MCDGQCFDTGFDNEHCGDCDTVCADNQLCGFGMCKHRKVIFATEGTFTGNIGGLDNAFGICNEVATDAQLPAGEFRPWLSNSGKSPSNLFETDGVYVLPTGDVVAWSWDDLTDGSILHPIDQTPSGQPLPPSPACNNIAHAVWTGTAADGTQSMPHCGDWLSSNVLVQGRVGSADATDAKWSDSGCPVACNSQFPIYCVQQ